MSWRGGVERKLNSISPKHIVYMDIKWNRKEQDIAGQGKGGGKGRKVGKERESWGKRVGKVKKGRKSKTRKREKENYLVKWFKNYQRKNAVVLKKPKNKQSSGIYKF